MNSKKPSFPFIRSLTHRLFCRYHNYHYRKKVMVAFLSVSLIPLSLLGGFCFFETKSLLTTQARNSLEATLTQTALSVNSQLEGYNQVSSALCYDKSLALAANMEYTSYYTMFDQLNYTIDDKFITARSLKSGIETITLYTGTNLPAHGNTVIPFSEAEAMEWYPLVDDSVNVRWIPQGDFLLCIQPVLHTRISNPVKNLIVTKISAEAVLESARALSSQSIGIFITDRQGAAVYASAPGYPMPALPEGATNASEDFHASLWSSSYPTGLKTPLHFQTSVNGTGYTMMSVFLPAAGWDMILYVPNRQLGRPAVLISLTVFVMILVCFVLVYLSSRLFSHRMVYRIETLRENMRTVADGALEVTVTSDCNDEIGEMIQDFDRMVTQISKLIQENYASELNRRQAEMKALQAQINPHFLYNSLSLINWRAIRLHANDISEMAQLLSSFYRTTLNKGKNQITVGDELLNVRSYTKIQLIMHNDSFDVYYPTDESLLAFHMPNLMLQPLVENAILHGIENKEDGRGLLTISCERDGEDILFTVSDNGIGIPPETIRSLLDNDSTGYGLKNVHERARILYGEPYGLSIQSTPGQGTTATLRIPALRQSTAYERPGVTETNICDKTGIPPF